ncbi:MAG: acetyl-CoA carboxylase biotin carboxyl carrier protein subunit [Faecousia sp.]|nr:acetyl-CoA carboxylase biotin carboxyl carrier protein subunit [Bacillota bacterium]
MYAVMVQGKRYFVEVSDSDASIQRVENAADTEVDELPDFDEIERAEQQLHTVSAVMPGTICKVLTHEGAQVKKDDVLFVSEAMKMELELRADTAGVVTKLLVAVGDHVEKGQPLAQIEAQ